MLPLLAAAALLAAPPAPRAARRADTVLHAEQLRRVAGVGAFLERAGARAPLLRPADWAPFMHPLFGLDPAHLDALASAGVDLAGPATVSLRGDGRVSCVTVADARAFLARADGALAALGRPERQVRGALTRARVTPDDGAPPRGYALQGRTACAWATDAGTDAGAALAAEAERLVGRRPAPEPRLGGLAGGLLVLRPQSALGLDGDAGRLSVDARSSALPLPSLAGAGMTPYGGLSRPGLLGALAHVTPAGVEAVADTLAGRLLEACRECPAAPVRAAARALAPQLTGRVLVHVERVEVRAPLRTPEGRFQAPRQVLVAELADPAAARAALAPLAGLPGAQRLEGGGVALALPRGGVAQARVVGRHLLAGNTPALLDTFAALLPRATAAPLPHGATFRVDPRLVAQGLGQVSLLDLAGGEGLAGLFALGLELGPLFAASDTLEGWLDAAPGGGHRLSLRWTLSAPARE